MNQQSKAKYFQRLHYQDELLLLPNAWDALSAKIYEQAGAKAIATTSAGIAASLGFPDGQRVPKTLFLNAIERIVSAVTIPVTADIEAGYGETLNEIKETVQHLIDIGVVGINIEDAIPGNPHCLESLDIQVKKIAALRELIEKQGTSLFLNARTDVYWLNGIPEDCRYAEAIERLMAYQEAGAHGLFIPGLQDYTIISQLVVQTHLPVNVLGGAWIANLDEIKNLGVARISVGSAPYRAMTTFMQQLAQQLLEGSFEVFEHVISYQEMHELFFDTIKG